ncbi:MAG TPA: hypothetical protein PKC30_10805 [Saprospiraceae bacterium]|nr:hypothetical protein [Saprospiraceae bacterium]
MNVRFFIVAISVMFLMSCGKDNDQLPLMELNHTFQNNKEGWEVVYSDYPVGDEGNFEFVFERTELPEPLDHSKMSLMLGGTNRSDDLFMGLKRKITGLSPGENYSISFLIEFASNVPDGAVGVGGSPGSSVYVKAGASEIEPVNIVDELNWYRLNIDKGNQAQEGENMVILGNFENGTDKDIYTLKTVSNDHKLQMKANNEGEIWLIIGTDSGFESRTEIYYNRISIEVY